MRVVILPLIALIAITITRLSSKLYIMRNKVKINTDGKYISIRNLFESSFFLFVKNRTRKYNK